MAQLVPLISRDGLVLVRWRNVVLLGMTTSPTSDIVQRMSSEVNRMRTDGERGTALVHLVMPMQRKPPPPDPETRQAYVHMMRDENTPIRGSAVILPDTGFTSALARSVITGLMLVARPRYPTKVFQVEREGCQWLAQMLDAADAPCGQPEELETVLRQLESRLAPPAS